MSNKLPYPEHLARGYPPGTIPERRRIIRCSNRKAWYSGKVGQIITVHYFSTFGCWDTEGRWLDYYDLSLPIVRELTELQKIRLLNQEAKRVSAAVDHMNKWADIPISMQLDSLCKILDIKADEAALNYCMGMLFRSAAENTQILFDSRKYEYSFDYPINIEVEQKKKSFSSKLFSK